MMDFYSARGIFIGHLLGLLVCCLCLALTFSISQSMLFVVIDSIGIGWNLAGMFIAFALKYRGVIR